MGNALPTGALGDVPDFVLHRGKGFVNAAIEDVGVDQGRADVFVAKQFLNGADGRADLAELGR
jgi:hypothetical protein